MYRRMKHVVLGISLLMLVVLGWLFVKEHQSEMFSGYREVFTIQRSSISVAKDLEQLAEKEHLVLARRIVDTTEKGMGDLENTYVPIGAEQLPSNLKEQEDPELIRQSGYNTLYLIVSGNKTASEVVTQLVKEGNEASVFPTEYSTVLLRLLLSNGQAWVILLVLVTVYVSLILGEYISEMRSIGIRRLAGQGKHQIAVEMTWKDSLIILVSAFGLSIGVAVLLWMTQLWSRTAWLNMILPIWALAILFVVIQTLLSNAFYYVLQHQPIYLSIKGKAPLSTLFLMVLGTQLFSIAAVMYCVQSVDRIDQQLSSLVKTQEIWQKEDQWYQLTSLNATQNVSEKDYQAFYEELERSVGILYRESPLNGAGISVHAKDLVYEPTPDGHSNVIYVNPTFLKKSGIPLTEDAQEKLDALRRYDELILLPDSLGKEWNRVKDQWIRFEHKGFAPEGADVEMLEKGARVEAASYESGQSVFLYPVFSKYVGMLALSTESFLSDPILIVRVLPMTDPKFNTDQMLVDHPERVLQLIRAHGLTSSFGNLTSGRDAATQVIHQFRQHHQTLILAAGISFVTSLLLIFLVNTLYLYQGRRQFLIQRLSGMSLVYIHRRYMVLLMIGAITLSGVAWYLKLSKNVVRIPIVYILTFLVLFWLQVRKSRKMNSYYLKGE